jgi:hypothetical protein
MKNLIVLLALLFTCDTVPVPAGTVDSLRTELRILREKSDALERFIFSACIDTTAEAERMLSDDARKRIRRGDSLAGMLK